MMLVIPPKPMWGGVRPPVYATPVYTSLLYTGGFRWLEMVFQDGGFRKLEMVFRMGVSISWKG